MKTKKRLLICGASGFIGQNLLRHFSGHPDFEVYAVCHLRALSEGSLPEGVRVLEADLTKAEDVERIIRGADVVLQAAAATSGSAQIVAKPWLHVTDNAVMNSLLFLRRIII